MLLNKNNNESLRGRKSHQLSRMTEHFATLSPHTKCQDIITMVYICVVFKEDCAWMRTKPVCVYYVGLTLVKLYLQFLFITTSPMSLCVTKCEFWRCMWRLKDDFHELLLSFRTASWNGSQVIRSGPQVPVPAEPSHWYNCSSYPYNSPLSPLS